MELELLHRAMGLMKILTTLWGRAFKRAPKEVTSLLAERLSFSWLPNELGVGEWEKTQTKMTQPPLSFPRFNIVS